MKPKPKRRKSTNAANVEPHRIRDAERARELGRLGGIASGEARREKRTLRAWAELLRDAPAPDGAEGETNAGAAIVAAYREAQAGNIQAVRFISELLGEMDAEAAIRNAPPPPPIVIGIHDTAFVEAERLKLEAAAAELQRLADGGEPNAAPTAGTGAEARREAEADGNAPADDSERVATPSHSPGGVADGSGEIDPDPEPPKPRTRREAVALMEAERERERKAKADESGNPHRNAAPAFAPFGFTRRR